MLTYYEVLQTSPDATPADIEQAYEKQYNHWRRLVTHHDPEMVNRANQALQLLQKIHATLTDPRQRATYNASLGATGGLADPNAATASSGLSQVTPPTTRSPSLPTAPVIVVPPPLKPEDRVDAWICPKCKQPNGLESLYCKDCGQTIGVYCPNCHRLIEAIAKFCPACGINVPLTLRRNELNAALARTQSELNAAHAGDPRRGRADLIDTLRVATVAAGAWGGLSIVAIAGLILGWDMPLPASRGFAAVVPNLIAFAVLMAFTFGLMVARRRFSFAAFVTLASAFVLLTTPYFVMPISGGGYSQYNTALIALSYAGVSVWCALSLLGMGINLGGSGCWVGLLVLSAMLAATTALAPQATVVAPMFLRPEDYKSFAAYVDMAFPVGLMSYGWLAVCFAIFGLAAWVRTHRTEYELAAALIEKEQRVARLESEIRNVTQELATLQKGSPARQ